MAKITRVQLKQIIKEVLDEDNASKYAYVMDSKYGKILGKLAEKQSFLIGGFTEMANTITIGFNGFDNKLPSQEEVLKMVKSVPQIAKYIDLSKIKQEYAFENAKGRSFTFPKLPQYKIKMSKRDDWPRRVNT